MTQQKRLQNLLSIPIAKTLPSGGGHEHAALGTRRLLLHRRRARAHLLDAALECLPVALQARELRVAGTSRRIRTEAAGAIMNGAAYFKTISNLRSI